jgi:hypothetical protein
VLGVAEFPGLALKERRVRLLERQALGVGNAQSVAPGALLLQGVKTADNVRFRLSRPLAGCRQLNIGVRAETDVGASIADLNSKNPGCGQRILNPKMQAGDAAHRVKPHFLAQPPNLQGRELFRLFHKLSAKMLDPTSGPT